MLVRHFVVALQIPDEQNLDVNLAYLDVHLVDAHLVDVVPVLNVVHLDELVLQVDVALMSQMKMDYYLHVVDVEVKMVMMIVKLVQMVLPQLVQRLERLELLVQQVV
jgi:hypothetical protein